MTAVAQKLTFKDVERLCERHLARRSVYGLSGYRLVRYDPTGGGRAFKAAGAWVSEALLERIDFDMAFRKLDKRSQKVLIAWYGRENWTQQQIADWLGCSPSTARTWWRNAIRELRDVMNGEGLDS